MVLVTRGNLYAAHLTPKVQFISPTHYVFLALTHLEEVRFCKLSLLVMTYLLGPSFVRSSASAGQQGPGRTRPPTRDGVTGPGVSLPSEADGKVKMLISAGRLMLCKILHHQGQTLLFALLTFCESNINWMSGELRVFYSKKQSWTYRLQKTFTIDVQPCHRLVRMQSYVWQKPSAKTLNHVQWFFYFSIPMYNSCFNICAWWAWKVYHCSEVSCQLILTRNVFVSFSKLGEKKVSLTSLSDSL